jgi:hypothetical protein
MTIHRQGVPIVFEPRRSTSRLDLRLTGIDQIPCAIREGEALHLYYENGRLFWSLSSERSVPADVATLLIRSASVAPVGDALFDGMPGPILLFDP